ncbi:MAG: sulfotransferase [Acidobacteriota bacterium]
MMSEQRGNQVEQLFAQDPVPIIVSAPRSGTTLLRLMLDSHPLLAIPPETGFLPLCSRLPDANRETFFQTVTNYPPDAPAWGDFQISAEAFREKIALIEPFTIAQGVRAFYQLYVSRFDKPRWGDKTPDHCFHLEAIESLLPESHFIHIIRDGRDVALSLRKMWFSPGSDIETLAAYWRDHVTTARLQGLRCQHYLEVRYPELILDTHATLESICRYLNLGFDDSMLRYYERAPARLSEHKARYRKDGSLVVSQADRHHQQHRTCLPPDSRRISVWKQEMTLRERAIFERIAGDALDEFGFEIASHDFK